MESPLTSLTGQPAPEPQHELISELTSGKLPGVNVPAGFKPGAKLSGLSGPDFQKAGLAMYRPHDPALMLTIFNPAAVSPDEVKTADSEGKLATLFPDVTQFDAPEAQEGPQSASRVPILPRPASGASGALAALSGAAQPAPVLPTERPIPAGGQLLNSLVSRAV